MSPGCTAWRTVPILSAVCQSKSPHGMWGPCTPAPRPDPPRPSPPTHGRHRRDRHLPPARRALEPLRAAVPQPRPEARRRASRICWRTTRASSRSAWAAQRVGPLLHGDQLAADRGRGRVHRRRLRREGVHHVGGAWPTTAAELARRMPGATHARSWSTARSPASSSLRGRGRRAARRRRSPTRPRAPTCSIPRAPPGRPKGVKRAAVEAQPIGTPQPAARASSQALYGIERRHDLPLAGAALPRRSAALQHDGAAPRRHRASSWSTSTPRTSSRLIEKYTRHAHASWCRPCSCAC